MGELHVMCGERTYAAFAPAMCRALNKNITDLKSTILTDNQPVMNPNAQNKKVLNVFLGSLFTALINVLLNDIFL